MAWPCHNQPIQRSINKYYQRWIQKLNGKIIIFLITTVNICAEEIHTIRCWRNKDMFVIYELLIFYVNLGQLNKLSLYLINVRDIRKGNKEWKIQTNRQHFVQKTQDEDKKK